MRRFRPLKKCSAKTQKRHPQPEAADAKRGENAYSLQGVRSYSAVSCAMCAARLPGIGLSSRHCQLAPWVLGVLMRASLPRCSQSASGMIAMSDTLASQAQIMASVRSSGLQRR